MPITTKVRKIGNSLGIVLQTLALAADSIGAPEFSAWLGKSCVPRA